LKFKRPFSAFERAVDFGFNAHDLRRTAATLMADAGVPENIIPKILNHTEPGVTRRHYNLHAYRGEKRAALERWARYLLAVLDDRQAKGASVIAFRQ
jgi:integrase